MTAEEIRAEAIERLAVGQFDIDEHDYSRPGAPARAWDAVPEGVRERYRVDAEPLVAALGDLLPTDTEDGQNVIRGFGGDVIQRGPWERRYVGDWKQVTA